MIAHNDFDASTTIKTYTHSCVFNDYFLFFLAFGAGYNNSRYDYAAGYLYLGEYANYIVGGITTGPGIFGFMLLDKTNSIYIVPYVAKPDSNSSTACLSYGTVDLPTTAWNGNKLLLQSADTGPYTSGYSSYVYGLRKK